MAYADWPRDAFEATGEVRTFEGRSFCPNCGSRLYSLSDDHAEIKIGTLDEAPTRLLPSEEIWVKRREPWLVPLKGTDQHREDPPRVALRLAREAESDSGRVARSLRQHHQNATIPGFNRNSDQAATRRPLGRGARPGEGDLG